MRRLPSLIMGAVVAALVSAPSWAANTTNALTSFGGLGNTITIGSLSYPRVTVSAGNSANSINVAGGLIQWIPGIYNPLIYDQRGVVDIALQNFTAPTSPQPFCMWAFDYYPMMNSGTSIQNIAGYQNDFATMYYIDSSNRWHAQVYFSYDYALNVPSVTNLVPWQIYFQCRAL